MPASSREKPKVICVRSLVPKQKNSASSAITSAVSAAKAGAKLAGTMGSVSDPEAEHAVSGLLDDEDCEIERLRAENDALQKKLSSMVGVLEDIVEAVERMRYAARQ